MIKARLLPLLEAMDRTLERGAYPELRFLIDFYHPHVIVSENANLVDRFRQICAKAQAGFDYESEHGRWSLLKHDHPGTVELRERGYYERLISEPASFLRFGLRSSRSHHRQRLRYSARAKCHVQRKKFAEGPRLEHADGHLTVGVTEQAE